MSSMSSSLKLKVQASVEGQKELDECARVFQWNYILMSAIGVWPLKPKDWWFGLNIAYLTYNMLMLYVDLFLFVDNPEHVVENLTESVAFTQIVIRMLMLRVYNGSLNLLVKESKNHFNVSLYNDEERKTFVAYNATAKIFLRFMMTFTALTASSYYLKPFFAQIAPIWTYCKGENVSFEFIMPYHFHTFYKLTVKSYFATYGSQLAFLFISGFGQSSADCLMVTLVYHVSAQMAVLATRIARLDARSHDCSQNLRQLVQLHAKLLRMGEEVRLSFSAALFTYLISSGSLLCVVGYQLILSLKMADIPAILSFLIFIGATLVIFYIDCTIGETFITESDRVCEAYLRCNWYEMNKEDAKMLCFGLTRSQKPMTLTAGKFTFMSHVTFTTTVKASMGYLSVLRAVM